jgi:23S rRNA (cytidine1920-2'-O)/16S rRNA (cytidine1409-2'-O)-methyltransferase
VAARSRLDAELVRRGLAATRGEAQRLIDGGRVLVDGARAGKAATLVAPSAAVALAGDRPRWASRGGEKLAGALAALAVSPRARECLDAGASTGGFTDVLLHGGAARVVAVDVGYGQLDWRLRNDPRVVVLERTNVRHLRPEDVPPPRPDLVVADLSFISLRLVLPALTAVAHPSGTDFVLLVKPQFEAGPQRVGPGGVVRDPAVWRETVGAVRTAASGLGLGLSGACASPLPGPAGNVEFFLHLFAGASGGDDALDAAVEEGLRLRDDGARER